MIDEPAKVDSQKMETKINDVIIMKPEKYIKDVVITNEDRDDTNDLPKSLYSNRSINQNSIDKIIHQSSSIERMEHSLN